MINLDVYILNYVLFIVLKFVLEGKGMGVNGDFWGCLRLFWVIFVYRFVFVYKYEEYLYYFERVVLLFCYC